MSCRSFAQPHWTCPRGKSAASLRAVRHCRRPVRCIAGLTTGSEGMQSNAGWIPSLKQRQRSYWPSYLYSREDAVQLQLQALRENDSPRKDHGVEVLYRFANIDLLACSTLSRYFGRRLDLGRFELFRWQFNEPPFSILLDHQHSRVLSSLQLSDVRWAQRVAVADRLGRSGVFEITMVQMCGGRHDGFWFTDSLVHDPDASGMWCANEDTEGL